MHHRYCVEYFTDGDYIVFISGHMFYSRDGQEWIEHTRWLIPGSQIED